MNHLNSFPLIEFYRRMSNFSTNPSITSPKIGIVKHIFAYITLGLLCGWYYFLLLFTPFLLYGISIQSYFAIFLFFIFLIISILPLSYEPWEAFMYSWIFTYWRDYFGVTYDNSLLLSGLDMNKKYIFFEFPHGIFPMGQFLSASLIKEVFPNQMICGTGADIVFKIPVMRHLMSWLGTHPASRRNITKILNKWKRAAIIPGGIAEMYLVNRKTEAIYLKLRRNTIKAAIEEGANIVPIFFFGNSRLFSIVGEGSGIDSWFARISRRFRASVVLFYGRHYLPIPLRHPIHMVSGKVVEVKQCLNPTSDDIDDVMNRLIESLNHMYETKKPSWEDRPLVIH